MTVVMPAADFETDHATLVDAGASTPLKRLGVQDVFACMVGSHQDLRERYGITAEAVVKAVLADRPPRRQKPPLPEQGRLVSVPARVGPTWASARDHPLGLRLRSGRCC